MAATALNVLGGFIAAGIGAVVGTYASHTLARWADNRKES